ncbi:MAG: hypothetical protein WCA84_06610 [Ignavibacteriaceae bacterium]
MSKLFSINGLDVLKGFLVAAGTVIITGIYTSLQNGALPTVAVLEQLGTAGLSGGIAYLLKNFFTNSTGQIAAAEASASSDSTSAGK